VTLLNYSVCHALHVAVALRVPGKVLEVIFVAVATVAGIRGQMTYAFRTENGRSGHAGKHLNNKTSNSEVNCIFPRHGMRMYRTVAHHADRVLFIIAFDTVPSLPGDTAKPLADGSGWSSGW
jgi:hypothetical protein